MELLLCRLSHFQMDPLSQSWDSIFVSYRGNTILSVQVLKHEPKILCSKSLSNLTSKENSERKPISLSRQCLQISGCHLMLNLLLQSSTSKSYWLVYFWFNKGSHALKKCLDWFYSLYKLVIIYISAFLLKTPRLFISLFICPLILYFLANLPQVVSMIWANS